MFLRWEKDGTHTIDLNQVVMVHKDETWGPSHVQICLDTVNNYVIVSENMTVEAANELENKILLAWKNRNYELLDLSAWHTSASLGTS